MSNMFLFHPAFRNHSYRKACHEDILDRPWSWKYWTPTPHEILIFPVELAPITVDMNPNQPVPISLFDNWVSFPRLQGRNVFPECRTSFIRKVSQENTFKYICWWPCHCIKDFMGKQDTDICRPSVFLTSIHLMQKKKTLLLQPFFHQGFEIQFDLKQIGHFINQPCCVWDTRPAATRKHCRSPRKTPISLTSIGGDLAPGCPSGCPPFQGWQRLRQLHVRNYGLQPEKAGMGCGMNPGLV